MTKPSFPERQGHTGNLHDDHVTCANIGLSSRQITGNSLEVKPLLLMTIPQAEEYLSCYPRSVFQHGTFGSERKGCSTLKSCGKVYK
jgi:hypothetical protein